VAGLKRRAFRARALYRALVVVSAIGRRIPLPFGQFLGRQLGRLAWHVARRERRKALANLAVAFPEWIASRRRDAVRGMFRHLGMCVFELAWLPNLTAGNRAETTEVIGIAPVMALIDSGKGVVVFTAHCGNWEWLSFVTGTFGRPVSVLQRERDQPEMNRYITGLRAKAGVHTIDRGSGSSARDMIQIIRRGGMLAFVVDQNIRTESVRIPFFGRDALTPIGPAKLAVRLEAAVVVAYAERLPNGRHRLTFQPPIQCTRGDDPAALIARVTTEIEAHIRRVPDQWVWMHDRWRDRPQWDVTEEREG